MLWVALALVLIGFASVVVHFGCLLIIFIVLVGIGIFNYLYSQPFPYNLVLCVLYLLFLLWGWKHILRDRY